MSAEIDRGQGIAAIAAPGGGFYAQYRVSGVDDLGADVLRVRFVNGPDGRKVYGSLIAAEAAAARAAFADLRGEERHPRSRGQAVEFKRQGGIRIRQQGGVIR